jgi:outer membrane protein assembly factor BamB
MKWGAGLFSDPFQAPSIASDGHIYLGGKFLYSFKPDSPTPQWKSWYNPIVSYIPIAKDGTIYFAYGTGKMIAMLTASKGGLDIKENSWPKPYHDNQNTGNAAVTLSKCDDGVCAVECKCEGELCYHGKCVDHYLNWYVKANGEFKGYPAIKDGIVYIGTSDPTEKKPGLYAFDVRNGNSKWKFDTAGDVTTCPVLGDKLIYVVSAEKNLYAIDNKGGTQAWYNKLEANTNISPSFGNENIFVATPNKVYAFFAESGKSNWSYEAKNIEAIALDPKKTALYVFGSLSENRQYIAILKSDSGIKVNYKEFDTKAFTGMPAFSGTEDSYILYMANSYGEIHEYSSKLEDLGYVDTEAAFIASPVNSMAL